MREMRPRHIVLFIAACLLLLGIVCGVAEYDKTLLSPLRWPTFSNLLNLPAPQPDTVAVVLEEDTVSAPIFLADSATLTAEVKTVNPDTLPAVKPSVQALDAFVAALREAGTRQVRVVHYGDSQIEEDRITATIRRNLQNLYGGGGVGLIPLHQTIPTRTVRQTLTMGGKPVSGKHSPQRYLVYGPKYQQRDSDNYGVMGQVALMDTLLRPGSDNMLLHIEPYGKRTSANYFSRVRLLKTDSIEVNARSGNMLTLPDSSTECTLEFFGQGEVYGISLETPTGVIVDNIPMRGGSGNVFTKIDAGQLKTFFRETNTRLIILQFGGNVMPWADTPERVRGYAYSMRKQIRHLRTCAPEASILFIGPSDMTTVVDGEKTSYPMLPLMDQQLARMAASEGIAYWSLYQAMGGWNSMIEWNEKGLAATDGVHFTQAGANKAGGMLWKWLEKKIAKSPETLNPATPESPKTETSTTETQTPDEQ